MQKLQIKEEIMAVAALLALGMLAIMPGLIAGSALTTSTKQVPNVEAPNVVTQASVAYCGYRSGWWRNYDQFGKCTAALWVPTSAIIYTLDRKGRSDLREGIRMIREGREPRNLVLRRMGWRFVRSGASLLRFTTVGYLVTGA